MSIIKDIRAFEVLNAKGRPTVSVELTTSGGITVEASAPSGTSKGMHEAYELFDNEKRYQGRGVKKAVENVNKTIREALIGMDVSDQAKIDQCMIELDGTKNKSRLGGNAILPVSVAVCKAGAAAAGLPVYRYIGGLSARRIPNILSTVITGGAFSLSGLEFEDYMLITDRKDMSVDDGVKMISDIRRRLEEVLRAKYGAFPDTTGALAPPLSSTKEAFEVMLNVINELGYDNYVTLGLDVAANELFDETNGKYKLMNRVVSPEELLEYYCTLASTYPLTYIEDGFEQNDYYSFARLKKALPQIQIVGDDLFATNVERLKEGIKYDSANTLLLKMNQIGTIRYNYFYRT
jgi:enolase